MVLALAGCGSNPSDSDTQAPANDQTQDSHTESQNTDAKEEAGTTNNADTGTDHTDASDAGNDPASSNSTLVVYFSCTGTTRGVAEMIAEVTWADLAEIIPAIAYTSDDLNWHDDSTRATAEQHDKSARPEISNSIENWTQYETVYLGYPIWWGEEPRILDAFVESYDFTGKTVIPFCTSGSSGVGNSADNLASLAQGSGNWLAGTRFGASASQSELSDWISELKMN